MKVTGDKATDDPENVSEFEALARDRMEPSAYGYYADRLQSTRTPRRRTRRGSRGGRGRDAVGREHDRVVPARGNRSEGEKLGERNLTSRSARPFTYR